ncbi:Hint domain-containing protein [Ruegeria sp. 6PALISEP08]|uniref:Hint domain-containing protein n=1 Tax=Ruegeria sp. 6PALISEP08 TaxID=1225660 RepID=UPI000B27CB7C|nr:Hint domain-containing protein [Ruegeria sp. 6PALISEP08]
MSEVTSISVYLNQAPDGDPTNLNQAVNARRGGFLRSTKIATTSGWKPIERIVVGERVRTLDHGFKEVRRISTSVVVIPADERRTEYLPVFVPARAAYNGRPVWLMPEQGIALNLSKIDAEANGISILPARMLNGVGRLMSQAPGSSFEVCSLFFDDDQVIFVEGGLQTYCPSGRFNMRGTPNRQQYDVADEEAATDLVNIIAAKGDMSALANPLGALPAPISQDPIFPIRPSFGVRRPGRPGRPNAPVLFLRPEWQI